MFEKVADAEFVRGEHDVLKLWNDRDIFQKLRQQIAGKTPWSFLDGPMTANNPMGVHHAWGRTYKDTFQRYWAMNGRDLRHQNGFDCQGLWVEVEVEKQLGLGAKSEIEKYGIDKFVNECKRRVLKYAAIQTEQSIRLGYWMEWDDPQQLRTLSEAIGTDKQVEFVPPKQPGKPLRDTADSIVARLGNPEWGGSYFTFSTENNETIWTFLKKCFERGKVYRGHDVMPWSGKGGSAYSQMEVADGRKLTVHRSAFVRFPLVDRPNEFLLVWTTTPWTLTSNVAAAVNPDLDYVKLKAKRDGAVYYFAKDNLDFQRLATEFKEGFGREEWDWPKSVPKLKTLSQIFKENGGYELDPTTIKGRDMIGWRYVGPFDDLPAPQEPGGCPKGSREVGDFVATCSRELEQLFGGTSPMYETFWKDRSFFNAEFSTSPIAKLFVGSGSHGSRLEKAEQRSVEIYNDPSEFDEDDYDEEMRKFASDDAAGVAAAKVPLEVARASHIGTHLKRFRSVLLRILHAAADEGLFDKKLLTSASFDDLGTFFKELGLSTRARDIWAEFHQFSRLAEKYETDLLPLKSSDEMLQSLLKQLSSWESIDVKDGQFHESIGSELWEKTRQFTYDLVTEVRGLPSRSVKDCHRVIDGGRDARGTANVTAGEGTGIVHIAPGCGDVDHKIGKELGLVSIAPLNEDGAFDEGFGAFTGMKATDPTTVDQVFASLKEKGLLVNVEQYPHIYPFCWRTGDELVFRLVDEWFINMDWRQEIMDVTDKIRWVPDSIQGGEREREWLTNMRDWMISKKRYWGLALPIWINPDDPTDFDVIGSLAELKERAVEGWNDFQGHTPHKPWIDGVKIKSQKTGAILNRVPDVGNPWLDAGIVSFSTMGFNSHPDYWKKWYPADLVTECFPGQFRNWFYSLLSMATMMNYDRTEDPDQKKPFKTLLGHRLVMNEAGKPMHKSDGTAIWFEEAAEQIGVDTMRWMYLQQNPASDLRFGTRHKDEPVTLSTADGPTDVTIDGVKTCRVTSTPADETRRMVLIPLWNSYSFFVNYARLDEFDPATPQVPVESRPELDRWILSNLQALTSSMRAAIEDYDSPEACRRAAAFIDDLSNWYIRLNRKRFWRSKDASDADKLAAYQTLYEVLVTLSKLLAPMIPFLSERMYQNLVRGEGRGASQPESVHLCDYPVADAALLDAGLNARMATAQTVVSLGLRLRSTADQRVRQPLAELRVSSSDAAAKDAIQRLNGVIREELNVKQLTVCDSLADIVKYTYKANLKTLGPKYGKLLNVLKTKLPEVDGAILAPLRSGTPVTVTLDGHEINLAPEDVQVGTEQAPGWVSGDDQGIQLALSTTLTPELLRGGMARDFIRQVQQLRKDADLEIENRIRISYATTDTEVQTMLTEWGDLIRNETLADSLTSSDDVPEETKSVNIGDAKVSICIVKV